MTTVTKIREGDVNFDLIINDTMPEIFTDGISHVLMGSPISKLTFHSVTNPADTETAEQRKGVLLLTISTPVLLELCRNILLTAQTSVDKLSSNGMKIDDQVKRIMEGVQIEVHSTLK